MVRRSIKQKSKPGTGNVQSHTRTGNTSPVPSVYPSEELHPSRHQGMSWGGSQRVDHRSLAADQLFYTKRFIAIWKMSRGSTNKRAKTFLKLEKIRSLEKSNLNVQSDFRNVFSIVFSRTKFFVIEWKFMDRISKSKSKLMNDKVWI